jgi:hypothetical protein
MVSDYQKNKKELLKKSAKRSYNRRQNDPLFRLSINIRRLISLSISNYKYTKKSKTHAILGCSYKELHSHIESKFRDGMSWENRSKWHIDHIIPLASAKTEDELLRLNHYTNLQPLWALDNLKKHAKMLK